MPRTKIKEKDIEYLKENAGIKTRAEIAEYLNLSINTIVKYAKKYNLPYKVREKSENLLKIELNNEQMERLCNNFYKNHIKKHENEVYFDDILQEIRAYLYKNYVQKGSGQFNSRYFFLNLMRYFNKLIKKYDKISKSEQLIIDDDSSDIYQEQDYGLIDIENALNSKSICNKIQKTNALFQKERKKLNKEDLSILLLREDGYTLQEIGDKMKKTRERIRQIEQNAIKKTKEIIRVNKIEI